MCGIVGVIGNQNTSSILLQGLEKLEYRGYDSAGIFVTNHAGDSHLIKAKGRITDLKAKISSDITGTMGIGHTRWATHGKPSEENAHPHTSASGRLVLVHNGVIENYLDLKDKYLKNTDLVGETDTEVVVQLIEYFMMTEGLTTKLAFHHVLQLIKGSYAFALVDQTLPDVIYVAKNKSPLLIGVGNGFHVICSDALAMITETNQFIEIHDQEMVTVMSESIQIEDFLGNSYNRLPFKAEIDATDIGKGTYPFYMLKEIEEQPGVIRNIVQKYQSDQKAIQISDDILKTIRECDRIYIIACGTSWHAGLIGKKLIETLTKIPTEVHLSSEFGYHMPLLSEKPFFIFLSQSGETADSRQVLVKIKQSGYPALTITNVSGSTLSRESDYTLLLHAGPEIAVASTKAYTAQVAVLTILAKSVGDSLSISTALSFDCFHELGIVANAIDSILTEKLDLEKIASNGLFHADHAFYIGRGVDYAVSLEAALKLKEVSYIHTEGFAGGELKHGTIALIEENTPVIGLITEKNTAAHLRGNLKEVESRGATTFIISTATTAQINDDLVLPEVHPLLSCITLVVPTQLIAYYAALHRNLDVDKPRNLAKSVTVE